jgi:hypothetical protein
MPHICSPFHRSTVDTRGVMVSALAAAPSSRSVCRRLRASLACALATAGLVSRVDAQSMPDRSWSEATAGSELENYLRALQLTGIGPRVPWTIRPLGRSLLESAIPPDSGHPWAGRFAGVRHGGAQLLRPFASAVFNSAFPYSLNDGPVWAGRGLTTAITFGAQARFGPLSIRLEPVAFRAENASFGLLASVDGDTARFADPIESRAIDRPQRFGNRPYQRLDLGESEIRVDIWRLAFGVASGSQIWGPATDHPLVLGDNAGGFPRAFVGSGQPIDLWLARVHGVVEVGRLDQSRFSPVPADSARRLMAGFVISASPRGLPGVEIGASRFFHRVWPPDGFSFREFTYPFEALLKGHLPASEIAIPDNQLASVFVRIAPPGSRIDVYGEYARNDHSQDVRDLLVEPDNNSAYMLGVRRAWRRSDASQIVALRAELVNARISHISRVRGQALFYQHDAIRQGHTQRGQELGSAAVMGGGGGRAAIDVYRPDGRWSVAFERTGRFGTREEAATSQQIDVVNALRFDRLHYGARVDVTLGAALLADLNHNFASDSYGLQLTTSVRLGGRRLAPR